MNKSFTAVLGLFFLTGCATPPPPKLWIRTDGQQAKGNLALEQEFELAKKICIGEASKATLSAGGNYNSGLVAHVIEEQKRAGAATAVIEGCMADKGYVLTEAENAETLAASYAQTHKPKPAQQPTKAKL